MLHRLLNLLRALSLLLCVAVVALWVRSDRVCDIAVYFREGGWYGRVLSQHGRVTFQAAPHCPFSGGGLYLAHTPAPAAVGFSGAPLIGSDGVRWEQLTSGGLPGLISSPLYTIGGPSRTSANVWVPHWALAAVTAAAPTWRIASLLRSRAHARAKRGLCPSCGYDLRATPGRCAECGTAPTPQPTTPTATSSLPPA